MVLPRKALKGQGGPFMKDWQSQAHVKWECKYHVVIIPKYRPKNSLREDSQASWGDTLRVVSTTGYRAFGRESDARPCSYVAEYSSEVQHCPHDWIFEGQERNPSPPERSEDKRHFARPELLVEGELRKHCRLGRERHSRIHQASGEAPTRTRSVESRTQLTAPFRGLPHTTGSARWLMI